MVMWLDYKNELLSVSSDVVHIWHTRLDCLTHPLETYQHTLSSSEIMRGNRFINKTDQVKFFQSKAILRQVLSMYLKIRPEKIEFEIGKNGKPYLVNTDLQFNLSHSGDFLLIAVTKKNEIGVDVECVRKKQDFLSLAERFFTTSEYEAIKKLSSENQVAAFYRCWTRKEAFMKATGLGLSFGLSEFEVAVENLLLTNSALLSIKKDNAESKKWTLQSVDMRDFSETYFAAFAVKQAVTSILYWNYQGESSSIDSIK